ncbi:MAG: DNA-binding domain-containing protein [Pseudomonadota bacterium]
MSLLAQQEAFLAAILDDEAPLPPGWGKRHQLGMQVYRGNYRSAQMDALADTYTRTAAYVGADAFRQASINHAIARPPSHWTIDAAGEGFAQTCAQLFGGNPEAEELAWLEWVMLELGSAPDCTPLSPEEFAATSAGFGDAEWMGLRLTFQPRAVARIVAHDLTALWQAGGEAAAHRFEGPQGCIAWREGERPTFKLVSAGAAEVFNAMALGAAYADAITILAGDAPSPEAIQQAATAAGAMLGDWLSEGLITALGA